jgi:hypothetical protein
LRMMGAAASGAMGPHPLDEAGLGPEAEPVIRDLLGRYERGGAEDRMAVRALLNRHRSFRWGASLPLERTPEGFRLSLLPMSADDHGADTRDELVALHELCAQARDAGVDLRPVLLEVAELSSAEDKHGMGSMRDILRAAAGRDPVGAR